MKNGIECAFCGKKKAESTFVIGASREPEWCMIEGTGKMTCPTCYPRASAEGQAVIKGCLKPKEEKTQPTFDIKRDGKIVADGLKDKTAAFAKLHKLCPSSASHAMKYEGYSIEESA